MIILSSLLCHSPVHEEGSYCKGDGKKWSSYRGGEEVLLLNIFLIYANHTKKNMVYNLQAGESLVIYKSPTKKKLFFKATVNHKLELNFQNSFCFVCWLACSLLFKTKTITRRLNCSNFDAI